MERKRRFKQIEAYPNFANILHNLYDRLEEEGQLQQPPDLAVKEAIGE